MNIVECVSKKTNPGPGRRQEEEKEECLKTPNFQLEFKAI